MANNTQTSSLLEGIDSANTPRDLSQIYNMRKQSKEKKREEKGIPGLKARRYKHCSLMPMTIRNSTMIANRLNTESLPGQRRCAQLVFHIYLTISRGFAVDHCSFTPYALTQHSTWGSFKWHQPSLRIYCLKVRVIESHQSLLGLPWYIWQEVTAPNVTLQVNGKKLKPELAI